MRHGSLFSGIGGFDLAAQWMGWENIFQVEWDKFCQKVLAKNFPNVKRYGDIKEFNGTEYSGSIDIISGGFPCQPYSMAGKRKGKEDERHLWPEMLRVIREVQPGWVLGENVPGIINWSRGMVFHEVQTDLEVEGYEIFPVILPAISVNAPHKRERIWFIAHSKNNGYGRKSQFRENDGFKERSLYQYKKERRNEIWPLTERSFKGEFTSNSDSNIGCERGMYQTGQQKTERYFSTCNARNYERQNWGNFPTQSPICGRNDGISNRVDRIKGLGNAIVPQVAFQIFKAIEQYNEVLNN